MTTTSAVHNANNNNNNNGNDGSWLRRFFGGAQREPGARHGPPLAAPARPHGQQPQAARPHASAHTPPHVHRFDASGWGHMVLVDSDGHGLIQLGDVMLSQCAKVARGMWTDATRSFCLFTIRRRRGCTDLAICRRDDPSAGCILVHDWSPARSLGIRLAA